jgi:hypothetical protein
MNYKAQRHAERRERKVGEIASIACLALALPLAAATQSADAMYCQALADVYRKTDPKIEIADVEVATSIAKCQAGDTSGIPVIEKALKDAKVELPSRI